MKPLAIFLILICITIYGQESQSPFCKYFHENNVTVNVIFLEHPQTVKQFGLFINEIGDSLRFKDDWDGLEFWMFIKVSFKLAYFDDSKEGSEQILGLINYWLKKHYIEKKGILK